MTILVMGYLQAGPGEGVKMRKLFVQHMADVNAEDGCEHYSFAYDAGDPDLIHIAERWASAEALAAHGAAPHQKAFGRALRDYTVIELNVKAWDGSFWRTLIGE